MYKRQVVNNVATLGGKAFAVGILGEDKGALNLKQILEENNVNTEGMFCDQNRKTITKTRVIAGGRATVSQQVVRIDYCAVSYTHLTGNA